MGSSVRCWLPTAGRAVRAAPAIGLLTLLFVQVVSASPARADSAVDAAADGLREDPLYVAPATRDRLDPLARDEVRARLRTARTPIFVAVLPRGAEDETWGDATRLPAAVYERVLHRGTYAVLVGDRLVASSTTFGESAARIAEQAELASSGDPALTLLDFIDGMERTAAVSPPGPGTGQPYEPRSFPWGLLFVAGVAGAGYLIVRRTRDRLDARLDTVNAVARDDLTAFGDDLVEADPDTSGLGSTNPGRWDPVSGDWASDSTRKATAFHRRGLDAFDRANLALVVARSPGDIAEVTREIAEGRYALSCARAAASGLPLPPRRAPCFYDPSHGPSSADVEWAPPSGRIRPVPVCATCADRLSRGDTPDARRVTVGKRTVAYWDAGSLYAPWAAGYYADYQECKLARLLHGTGLGAVLTGSSDPRGPQHTG